MVLEALHSERFVDAAPATVYATLLDEGTYLASESTMYRLLRERRETGDRRRHATHPAERPALTASNLDHAVQLVENGIVASAANDPARFGLFELPVQLLVPR